MGRSGNFVEIILETMNTQRVLLLIGICEIAINFLDIFWPGKCREFESDNFETGLSVFGSFFTNNLFYIKCIACFISGCPTHQLCCTSRRISLASPRAPSTRTHSTPPYLVMSLGKTLCCLNFSPKGCSINYPQGVGGRQNKFCLEG